MKQSIEKRFDKYVTKTQSCWLWNGYTNIHGYGRIMFNKKSCYAHRVFYEFFKEKIPPKMTLDHLCRVRNCVNPNHLEPVTQIENLMRGLCPPAINARKTHCKYGHEFTPENTYIYLNGSGKRCRQCKKRRDRAE